MGSIDAYYSPPTRAKVEAMARPVVRAQGVIWLPHSTRLSQPTTLPQNLRWASCSRLRYDVLVTLELVDAAGVSLRPLNTRELNFSRLKLLEVDNPEPRISSDETMGTKRTIGCLAHLESRSALMGR